MTRYILMDQIMPLDFDGRIYYLVLKESSSHQELIDWALSRSMDTDEYKIIERNPL